MKDVDKDAETRMHNFTAPHRGWDSPAAPPRIMLLNWGVPFANVLWMQLVIARTPCQVHKEAEKGAQSGWREQFRATNASGGAAVDEWV